MTAKGKFVVLVIGFLLTIPCARAAENDAETPARFARTLVMVQDQIVLGSTAALESVPELRRRLAAAIANAPVATWKDPQQSRALAIHLLNGGAPQVVRRLFEMKADFGQWREVVMALLAHAERKKDAAQQLGAIDARMLDPSIAGPFALAQAIANSSDFEKAKPYLYQARLLSPGSLVEDSAMRREMELLIAAGKKLEAAHAAARYLWRFGSSLYAKDVVVFLAGSFLPELASVPGSNGAIVRLTDELPAPARLETFLKVARNAMLKGSIQAAEFAAARAFDLAPSDSAARSQAALYTGIARAFSDPTGTALDKLRESDIRTLSGEDLALLQGSLLTLKRIRAPIDPTIEGEVSSSAAIEAAAQAVSAAQAQLDMKRP